MEDDEGDIDALTTDYRKLFPIDYDPSYVDSVVAGDLAHESFLTKAEAPDSGSTGGCAAGGSDDRRRRLVAR